jgi:hypothetical protein
VPSREDLVEKPAYRKIVSLLTSVGVDVVERLAHRARRARPEGPPITIDDVIDFHFLLSTDDWVEGLMASAE